MLAACGDKITLPRGNLGVTSPLCHCYCDSYVPRPSRSTKAPCLPWDGTDRQAGHAIGRIPNPLSAWLNAVT